MNDQTIGGLARISLQNALSKRAETVGTGAPEKDARDRQRVAQEFSSLLFLEALKSMRAALPQEGFGENESLSRDLYTNMMDAEIARVMAKRDSTGLTRAVEKSLDKLAPRPQMAGEPREPSAGVISSLFGSRIDPINGQKKFHHGVDIAAPAGTPVKAAAAGKVVFAGHRPGYGNLIEVDHGNGLATRYGHNSANLVAAGQQIQAGQAIALVGATGRATGSHVHFEVLQAGNPVDPATLVGDLSKGSKLSAVI